METKRKLFLFCIAIIGILLTCWLLRPAPPDLKLMWETIELKGNTGGNGKNLRGSTARAVKAAERVFTNMSIIGMHRNKLIETLGDPSISSDSIYNFPFYPPTPGSLVYRFDTGMGGLQFDVVFDEHEIVTKIVTRGIE